MFTLSKLSSFAAVATLVVLGGFSLPSHADELAQNLGRSGPTEPDSHDGWRQARRRFLRAGWRHCGLHVVVWDRTDDIAVARRLAFEVTLNARQMVHIGSARQQVARSPVWRLCRVADDRRL